MQTGVSRRRLLRGATVLGGGLAASALLPAWARSQTPGLTRPAALSGEDIRLSIGHSSLKVDGREAHAVAINGEVPGPLIRLTEGQTVRLHVTNTLQEDTSIHWHGLLVPFQMDGVPGVSFPGIKPGETFVYEFPVIQSGTYWYPEPRAFISAKRARAAPASSATFSVFSSGPVEIAWPFRR